MAAKGGGVLNWSILDTPFAIVDFETTGLNAGIDRVVEIAVVRKEPKARPHLVLNTLINPQRRVAATEIHGITDEDVRDAPLFEEVAGELARALSGCIVASYNVYFDIPFLTYELGRVGIKQWPPHLCLMYLRPMLGLGPRCSLSEACRAYGIEHIAAHVAWADAQAATQLMETYLERIAQQKLSTFCDLMRLKTYKFVSSFHNEPLPDSVTDRLTRCNRVKPRGIAAPPPTALEALQVQPTPELSRVALGEYWDALTAAIADLEISDEEVLALESKRRQLGLREEHVRVLYARAFASAISQFVDDQRLDDQERQKLRRLHRCLARLGWAPGE